MCLLITRQNCLVWLFAWTFFLCRGFIKCHPLYCGGRAMETMGTKTKNKRKKKTLDQSALAKLALVQRQLALEIRNKAVPLCKLFL